MKYHIVYFKNDRMIKKSFIYGSTIRHFIDKYEIKNYIVLHGNIITFKGVEDEKKG